MKFHISYQVIVWSLVMIALVMAGGFLTISYTYRVQEANSKIIEENIRSVRAAKELEITLHGIRAISLNYIIDKDSTWVTRLREKEAEFDKNLENAKESANSEEENILIQRITALFSNYEQNLNTPSAHGLERRFDRFRAGVHGQRAFVARQLTEVFQERSHLVVVKRPRGQRDPVELGFGRGDDGRVAMTLIHRGIRGKTVEVLLPLDVPHPGAFGALEDDGQGMVVVRAVAVDFAQVVNGGGGRHRVRYG